MRKKPFSCIVVILVCHAAFGQVNLLDEGTRGLRSFTKNYFRSDPLYGSFSGFLTHLINDPDIDNKIIRKKTDTSFYHFSGVYKKNNPFGFIPKQIKILLEETSIDYDDSLHTTDTIFVYQMIAYVNDDNKSVREIKKEFDKIHRQYNRRFYETKYLDQKKEDEITMAAYHFFVITNWIAPLTVAWGKLESSHEVVLNITLRIKMSANKAVLPAPIFN